MPLPRGELNSLLEKLLYRFSWNAVTLSRTWAGDELHSFVLSWFIAFNAPRQQSPKSFSQRFISTCASVLGRNQLIPSSVLPLSPRSPGQGVPSAAPAASPSKVTPPMKPQRSFLAWDAARALPRCFPTIFSILGLWWGWAFLHWKCCHPLFVGGSTRAMGTVLVSSSCLIL